VSEPEGAAADWTEERRRSDEGRRRVKRRAKCPVLAVPPSALMDEVGHGLKSWHLRRHVLTQAV